MKIESPFGPMEVYFSRNNHCILFAYGEGHIKINGVELTFRKEFAVIDNHWQPVADNTARNGKFYINTYLNLRFRDYNRSGFPSNSAHDKLLNWFQEFFLVDLNRGTYSAECRAAENNHFKKEIQRLQEKIVETNKQLDIYRFEIFKNIAALEALPEK